MPELNPVIVPNVEQIAREMTGTSQIGMIIKRVRLLNLLQLLKLGFNNLIYLNYLLQKDFAAGIKLLCELEILHQLNSGAKFEKKHFALHHQMVDMAVALKNRRLISYFLTLAKTYNFQPGLVTCNPLFLLKFLADVPIQTDNLVIYISAKLEPNLEKFLQESQIIWKEL